MNPYEDAYFLPPKPAKLVPREEFLQKGIPRALGNGWVEFVRSDYATLERRARSLVHCDDISSVDEGYDIERYNERGWCTVHLKNSNKYYVKATYDEMKELLTSRKGDAK